MKSIPKIPNRLGGATSSLLVHVMLFDCMWQRLSITSWCKSTPPNITQQVRGRGCMNALLNSSSEIKNILNVTGHVRKLKTWVSNDTHDGTLILVPSHCSFPQGLVWTEALKPSFIPLECPEAETSPLHRGTSPHAVSNMKSLSCRKHLNQDIFMNKDPPPGGIRAELALVIPVAETQITSALVLLIWLWFDSQHQQQHFLLQLVKYAREINHTVFSLPPLCSLTQGRHLD